MVADTGIEIKRLNNWFVNNRIRFWKPRFEAMQKQLEQQKKRKLNKSEETSASPDMSSMPPPPPKVTPRRTSSPKQDATKKILQVISPSSSLLAPRLDLSILVHTASNASATVSDDDSDNEAPRYASKSSGNSDFKKTSMYRRCRKRQRTEIEIDDLIAISTTYEPSPRFNSNDVEQWKLACSGWCPKHNDTNLPSLDEAVQLFGYSNVTSQ